MPGLVVNATEAMENRKPLPEGEYHVTLTNSKVKPAVSADKYPMMVLEFTVNEDEGEFAGKKAFRNLSAAPNAVPFMVDAAVALGADPDEVVQTSVDMEAVFTELRGAECWIITSIRKYQRDANSDEVEQTNVDRISAGPSA
jgi:hypothetical protein